MVFSHFVFTFYQAAHTGETEYIHSRFDLVFGTTPLNIFYNGRLGVSIFYVLSGYVLSYAFFVKKENEYLISAAIKRFPRLYIPTLFSIIVCYLLLVFNAYDNVETGEKTFSSFIKNVYLFKPDFLLVFRDSVELFFVEKTRYNPVLWTMHYELFGSFLVFLFLVSFGKSNIRWIWYLIGFWFLWDTSYFCFLAGMLLCDSNVNFRLADKIQRPYWAWLLLFSGIYLGSYPNIEFFRPEYNTIYDFVKFDLPIDYIYFYRDLGAILILTSILFSKTLQNILMRKTFQSLGKISFGIYLIHFPILASFSCWLFNNLYPSFNYHLSFVVTLIGSLVVIIVSSFLITKYVDEPSILFSRRLYEFLKSAFLRFKTGTTSYKLEQKLYIGENKKTPPA